MDVLDVPIDPHIEEVSSLLHNRYYIRTCDDVARLAASMNRQSIHFQIERALGKGGCGEVHLAAYNGKEVAAKKALHISPLQKAQV